MKNPYIWVLYDAFETDTLYSNLDGENLEEVAKTIFDHVEDESDPDALKSVEEVKNVIVEEVINGANHKFEFGAYSLSREELNVGAENIRYIEDPDFKAEAAATVFEAGQRVELGGCDMSYAIIPAGWFTRKLDHKDFDNIEWIERILK